MRHSLRCAGDYVDPCSSPTVRRMSRVGLGCARLGSAAPGYGWRRSVHLVQSAIDADVTYFDTADAYQSGTSELVLGRALRGLRGAVSVATKGGYQFTERSPLESR